MTDPKAFQKFEPGDREMMFVLTGLTFTYHHAVKTGDVEGLKKTSVLFEMVLARNPEFAPRFRKIQEQMLAEINAEKAAAAGEEEPTAQ